MYVTATVKEFTRQKIYYFFIQHWKILITQEAEFIRIKILNLKISNLDVYACSLGRFLVQRTVPFDLI